MRVRNGKLALEPSSTEPPKPVTITITKEQMAGIVARQTQLNAIQDALNQFLSGVVGGHGYDKVQVTAVDDVKRTLTLTPQ